MGFSLGGWRFETGGPTDVVSVEGAADMQVGTCVKDHPAKQEVGGGRGYPHNLWGEALQLPQASHRPSLCGAAPDVRLPRPLPFRSGRRCVLTESRAAKARRGPELFTASNKRCLS